MATRSRFEINGVIDTAQNVFENIELLATSAGCFVTWDPSEGHWSIIVNEAGSSVFSFTDSNIIGAITVGGSGVNELYNSVELEYPHRDLRDAVDYITVSIDPADRFANELDNQLTIKLNTINDPVQARVIATQELKQNRVDKVIEFQSDFTANGIKAGDIVSVTNTALDFTSKLFRVIQISEEDSDDGAILYNITALEYSSDVYNISGLTYDYRTKNTGIPSKIVNEEIVKSDAENIGDQLNRLLLANIALGLFNPKTSGLLGNILKSIFGAKTNAEGDPVDDNGDPILETIERYKDKILGGIKLPDLEDINGDIEICEGETATVTVSHTCEVCLFDIPTVGYPYEITGVDAADVDIPLTGYVEVTDGEGTLEIPTTLSAGGANFKTMTVEIGGLTHDIDVYAAKDYSYVVTAPASVTEGANPVVTLNATGSKANATIPYEITGPGTARITTPLTGTVTTVSGTATLTINTVNDGVYTGDQDITVTFEPGLIDPCETVGENSKTITIVDNEAPPVPTLSCEWIEVPLVWCAVYNGTDFQLEGLTVEKTAFIPKPLAGEGTVSVPLTVSVTKGNPSTVTVVTTAEVASSNALGGIPFRIITSFNSVSPKGLIIGTGVTVYGYQG